MLEDVGIGSGQVGMREGGREMERGWGEKKLKELRHEMGGGEEKGDKVKERDGGRGE